MKTKAFTLQLTIGILFAASMVSTTLAGNDPPKEQHLKAAFLFNFVKFVEWPDEKTVDKEQ
jgi:hypothetical protein